MRRITTIISETYVSFRLIQSLQFNSHFILSLSVMCHLSSVSQISIFFIFQHFLPSILWLFVFRSSFFSFSLLLVYFSSPCRLSVGTFSISIEVASSCYLIVPRHLLFIRHQRMCVCFKKRKYASCCFSSHLHWQLMCSHKLCPSLWPINTGTGSYTVPGDEPPLSYIWSLWSWPIVTQKIGNEYALWEN